jgi:hypothetical protein
LCVIIATSTRSSTAEAAAYMRQRRRRRQLRATSKKSGAAIAIRRPTRLPLLPKKACTEHQLFQVNERSISIDFLSKHDSNAFLNLFPSVLSPLQALWQARCPLVFQLPGELKSLQNGSCATQIFTFGRRPQPPLRQGDSLDTPCSCMICAPARP